MRSLMRRKYRISFIVRCTNSFALRRPFSFENVYIEPSVSLICGTSRSNSTSAKLFRKNANALSFVQISSSIICNGVISFPPSLSCPTLLIFVVCPVMFRRALRMGRGLLRSSERGTLVQRVRPSVTVCGGSSMLRPRRRKAGSVERVPPAESDSRGVC